jgi:hypothetical protein
MGKVYPKHKTNNNPDQKGLRPIRDTETARRLGRLGGLANKGNPNLIIASKLRWLKKKGLTDETANNLFEIMTEHNLSALDVRIFLESIKKDVRSARDKTELARSLIEWHKMHHGTINKNMNVNMNLDVDIDIEQAKEHLSKFT